MSTEKIFGTWDGMPKTGYADEHTWLWHKLAAQKIGTPEQRNNSGLTQRRDEFTMFLDLVRRAQPRVVLEIGTAQGGSFAALCQVCPTDATMISMDRCINDARPRPDDPVNRDIYNGPLLMAEQGGGIHHLKRSGQTTITINGWSYAPMVMEQLKGVLGGRTIDLIFHDASHEADMAIRDFYLYWPLVSEGGIFASHDICPHPSDAKCNKSEAWDRFKEEADCSAIYEFRCHPRRGEGMGIGILIR